MQSEAATIVRSCPAWSASKPPIDYNVKTIDVRKTSNPRIKNV